MSLTTLKTQPEIDPATGLPKSIADLISENYSPLNVTRGDLDLDGIEDIVLILKKDDEEATSDVVDHPEKRPLFLFLGQADGSYVLVAENENAVLCVSCGGILGDPFQGVTIKDGYFSVEHYGGSAWRWTRIVTFKYDSKDKKWYLHKDGGDSYHNAEPDKITSEVKTVKDFGIVPFENYDIYQE